MVLDYVLGSEKYKFDSTDRHRTKSVSRTNGKMWQISRSFDRSLSLFSLLSENCRIPPIFFFFYSSPNGVPQKVKLSAPKPRVSSNIPVWHTFALRITQTDRSFSEQLMNLLKKCDRSIITAKEIQSRINLFYKTEANAFAIQPLSMHTYLQPIRNRN